MALISIVTATYNRAAVLRLTIDALRRSTREDWELLVIGDACTDDTERVVAAFDDPRIRFVTLAANSGDQAIPNNEGVRLARSPYLAFLNHDDLWTRDHLDVALHALEASNADFVSTLTLAIGGDDRTHLAGVCPRGTYDPSTWIPASSWVMRRELAERIGPWRRARELYAAPSQDWLFRAYKAGAAMHAIERVTVLAVMSGGRKNSYADAEAPVNEEVARRLREEPEALLRELLTGAALSMTKDAIRPSLAAPLARFGKNALRRAAIACGIHPMALYNAVTLRRKGGLIDSLRRTRGLPPLPRTGGHDA